MGICVFIIVLFRSLCMFENFQNKDLGKNRDFPGSPVVKTPRFHCGGDGFDPWLGN